MPNTPPSSTDGLFPIRELSARTQVNTVTIRTWERRYGLLNPQRTAKGHRLYGEDDVHKIEQILALVARGAPLGKLKDLLTEGEGETFEQPEDDAWLEPVEKLLAALRSFSKHRVEALLNDNFRSYPPSICREKLIAPVLAQLQKQETTQAGYYFAESEILRYAALRLSSTKEKAQRQPVLLVGGDKAPLWRLAIMALELADADHPVQLIYRPFDEPAWLALAASVDTGFSVFYQDGVWKPGTGKQVMTAIEANPRLIVCGTAPSLFGATQPQQVFPDLEQCARSLLAAPE